MQKREEKFFEKIVKKDYNDKLEKILEKKAFAEDAKSILLNILYKIEASYKDYKQVKQNVETKEEIIEGIIETIQNECQEIKLINPNSEESSLIGNRTFLVEKNYGKIYCYNIERKLLYCLSKIEKSENIINDKYFILKETLKDLINVGDNINEVEPLRDFNGYSWTTIPKEIESIEHNLIYQNLILLVGIEFMKKWIKNKEILIDYLEIFENKIKENYGENGIKYIEDLKEISILLEMKFDQRKTAEFLKLKQENENALEEIQDNVKFVEKITKEKRKLTEQIKNIDETINNKDLLQQEYIKRNENLPLEKKIFSMRILSQLMVKEREEKIVKIEELNKLLNPQNFVKYKKDLEQKQKYLKLLDTQNIDGEIEKLKLEMQKIFMQCMKIKIEKAQTKQEMQKLVYEYRYYLMLPYNKEGKSIYEIKDLEKEQEELTKTILEKAHKTKVIQKFSKQEEADYKLMKNIFTTRAIKLEEIYIKLTKEKDEYFIHIYDENSYEEKTKLEMEEELNKRQLEIRFNKKVKAFY